MKNFKRISTWVAFFIALSGIANAQVAAKGSLFNPLFFRAGVTGGVLSSGGTTGTMGFRMEYGLSQAFSMVGDGQMNSGNRAYSGGQGTLALRYAPLNLNRFQPYVSVGFGAASGMAEHGRHCHHQQVQSTTSTQTSEEITTTTTAPEMHKGWMPLAVLTLGTNYRISNHIIAQAEAVFQGSRHAEGAMGLRAGMAYQFGAR